MNLTTQFQSCCLSGDSNPHVTFSQALSAISVILCTMCINCAVERWEDLKKDLQQKLQKTIKGKFQHDLTQFYKFYGRNSCDDYLVIDAVIEGFTGYRSWRRDNPKVPSLANHRLFSTAASRRGLGKPMISRLFPAALWQCFEDPVKHFLLQASEHVGTNECPPVYPNLPSPEELDELIEDAVISSEFDIAQHAATLSKAVSRGRG